MRTLTQVHLVIYKNNIHLIVIVMRSVFLSDMQHLHSFTPYFENMLVAALALSTNGERERDLFYFHNLIILFWEIWVAFPGKDEQPQEQR